jgi:hypothetical protein
MAMLMKAESVQVVRLDEDIDHARRIVVIDVVCQALRCGDCGDDTPTGAEVCQEGVQEARRQEGPRRFEMTGPFRVSCNGNAVLIASEYIALGASTMKQVVMSGGRLNSTHKLRSWDNDLEHGWGRTGKFVCDGNEIKGISTQAPIYAELEGKRAGDAISFNGREFVIEEVA